MQVGLEILVAALGCAVATLTGWGVLQTLFVMTFGRSK
jgi:hypothetical protein